MNSKKIEPRVLIVADSASAKFGGEAILPLHYYRYLSKRGIYTLMVVHERTKSELELLFPEATNIFYVPDTSLHKTLWKIGRVLPHRINLATFGFLLRVSTLLEQVSLCKKLIAEHHINLIHQPTPVSPKEPSLLYGLDIPVIFGPMNGGMEYPAAFKSQASISEEFLIKFGRKFAVFLNKLMPGKLKAALLLVANQRTLESLPDGLDNVPKEILVENGVDLTLWKLEDKSNQPTENASVSAVTKFIFMGRLVDWKAVDILILAFAKIAPEIPIALTIIGDGSEKENLEKLALRLSILGDQEREAGKVFFAGWQSQQQCAQKLAQYDALVLSSLYECGGAVVLEAMAMKIPVIATKWGGPVDYIDESCGILVEPSSREDLINGFADAMKLLAISPEKRLEMGECGRNKVVDCFDWEKKVDNMIEIYQSILRR